MFPVLEHLKGWIFYFFTLLLLILSLLPEPFSDLGEWKENVFNCVLYSFLFPSVQCLHLGTILKEPSFESLRQMQVHLLWQKKHLHLKLHLLRLQTVAPHTSVRLINQVLSVHTLHCISGSSCTQPPPPSQDEVYGTGLSEADWDLLAIFSMIWLTSQNSFAMQLKQSGVRNMLQAVSVHSLCDVCLLLQTQQRASGIYSSYTWSKILLEISAAM